MYHSISEVSAESQHPYYEIRTSPSHFRAQMAFFRDAGFATLFPSQISAWFKSHARGEDRAVCLTFDDGYEDFLTAAFPVLREFGLKSTVYVPTGLVGGVGPKKLKLLSWSQIRELAQAGVNFGSHTVSHPDMTALPDVRARQELEESKKTLESALGIEVSDFCHPFAFPEHDRRYVTLYRRNLAESGYRTGATTIIGTAFRGYDPFLTKRLPVNEWDDRRFMIAKLNGAYDWMHPLQYWWKSVGGSAPPGFRRAE